MQQVPRNRWSVEDSSQLYKIDRWGCGFFSISSDGGILVHPDPEDPAGWDLAEIVRSQARDGVTPPILVRFPAIIRQRMATLCSAFADAIEEYEYRGKYSCVFPVKVNQHQEVIESVLKAGRKYGAGLEAGSKAELLAIIAMADNRTPILCNGFKDEMFMEMAIRATQLGRNVTVIIEKPNEVDILARVAERLGAKPRLGIRVKLAARGTGHWQGSGGIRSKFGLTATELLDSLAKLRRLGLIDQLHLLHFHPGSQISNIRHIKASLIEVTRIYADLVKQGVPLSTLDVGGGLAVDYTGNRNTEPSSMNYTLREYANDVVYYIQMVCDQMGVSHPNIVSESGRALVAHHSVLVVPVIGTSQSHANATELGEIPKAPPLIQPLSELEGILSELDEDNVLECYHDAQQAMEIALQLFTNGLLTLQQRSTAERLFWAVCQKIYGLLDELDFVPKELEEIQHMFADTYFANFSVFQSLPDQWAIDQLFPVMPLQRLGQRPTRQGTLGDITCDSDGRIDMFIGPNGTPKRSLPLHRVLPGQEYLVGIFMVGAYQEVLGDDHNLFGKVNVVVADGDLENLKYTTRRGTSIKEVLEHVHHSVDDLLAALDRAIDTAVQQHSLDREIARDTSQFFRSLPTNYTYLVEDQAAESDVPLASSRHSMAGSIQE